jgi:ubiquinone/menaquinone biosynthesis C-methylase UbiE
MKIFEKCPERYDVGFGSQSGKIRDEIISKYVKPDIKMLDLGCGIGELIEKSAKIGADVSGLDISKGMLLSMNILASALVSIVLFFINPLLVLYFDCDMVRI